MNEAKPAPSAQLAPGLVRVVGKITRTRRYDGKWYTTVMRPARDEYSRPSMAEIRSAEKIGAVDELVDLRCDLGGYEAKSYRVTDKDTGESRMVHPVNHTLDYAG